MKSYIDLSHPIEHGMPVYPGDENTELRQTRDIVTDKYTNFTLSINMHAGTHIDSPMHLLKCNRTISEYSLDSFSGHGVVLDVCCQSTIDWRPEYENKILPDSIVLLYTGSDKIYGTREYFLDHPTLTTNFCKGLLDKKVKIIGMDMPSPDRPPFEVHKFLLSNGIFILENLTNLDKLLPVRKFEVFAFPLPIRADSSIVRAVARFDT